MMVLAILQVGAVLVAACGLGWLAPSRSRPEPIDPEALVLRMLAGLVASALALYALTDLTRGAIALAVPPAGLAGWGVLAWRLATGRARLAGRPRAADLGAFALIAGAFAV